MSKKDSSVLLETAEVAAKSLFRRWIRTTLCQVSLEVLTRLWRVEQTDATTTTLHVTETMLSQCKDVCRRLATFWCRRLCEKGQDTIANWINEFVAVDTGGFWQEDSQPMGDARTAFITAATRDKEETNPNTDTSNSTTNNKKNEDSNNNNNNKNDDNDDDKEKASNSRKDCKDESSLLLLPWTRLKRLGEQQPTTNANLSARDMIDVLDRMGENHETMWPHDWSLIQQATQDVVPNLHSGSSTPRAAFELVPKSIIARQQQQQQQQQEQDTSPPNDNTNNSSSNIHSTMQVLVQSNRMKSLLKRKRELQEEPAPRSVVRRRPAPPPLPAIPRQPSSHAEQEEWEWDVIRKTVENKEELIQEMVHHEDYPDPDAVLLGALKPVGRFHYCYKSDDNDDEPGWTDKQKRRAVRKAAKERLYPLTVLKDDRDSHKQQQQQQRHLTTKVVRARHDATDDYYTEFDLGECILECNGKVCAFSSLEVSLKDEKKKKTPN